MFKDILGNNENKKILDNTVKKGQVIHSYMFVGKAGIGKFLFAKEFAKAILCNGENKPCQKCASCISFEGENNPDITIINEKEKSIKTETIKEMVKSVYEKPIKSSKKVYIINDSEKMTKEAQNSLLKTLEEPPEYIVIILITETDNVLLNTIRSRCTKIKFHNLKEDEIKRILQEKYSIENISDSLLELADGSIQKALEVYGKEDFYNSIKDIFSSIEKIDLIDLLNIKEDIFKNKEDVLNILDYINIVVFNKSKDDIKYAQCINIIEDTKLRLKKNSNYDMTIDNMLLKLWEEING